MEDSIFHFSNSQFFISIKKKKNQSHAIKEYTFYLLKYQLTLSLINIPVLYTLLWQRYSTKLSKKDLNFKIIFSKKYTARNLVFRKHCFKHTPALFTYFIQIIIKTPLLLRCTIIQ